MGRTIATGPAMKNSQRLLLDSVVRYAAARGLGLERLSHDWILRLTKPGRSHVVFGYDLGANSSTAHRVANDKSATFEVLSAAGVDAVEHCVFLHPRFLDFVAGDGNWTGLLATFERLGRDVVVKDNEGTGGLEVYRARSLKELEQRVHALMLVSRSVALSPFLPIEVEMRMVMLGAECLLAYRKQRPHVVGDGRSTLAELMARSPGAAAAGFDNPDVGSGEIPAEGRVVPLQWRHNLGLGARPVAVEPGDAAQAAPLDLARRAMAAIGLRFASIDLVVCAGRWQVLEANSGVMLEVAGRAERGGSHRADAIYHRVLDEVLRGPPAPPST